MDIPEFPVGWRVTQKLVPHREGEVRDRTFVGSDETGYETFYNVHFRDGGVERIGHESLNQCAWVDYDVFVDLVIPEGGLDLSKVTFEPPAQELRNHGEAKHPEGNWRVHAQNPTHARDQILPLLGDGVRPDTAKVQPASTAH